MRKLNSVWLFVLFLLPIGCNNTDNANSVIHDASPVFLSPGHMEDWFVEHEFKYRNQSGEAVDLFVKSTTCGCAISKIEDNLLEPGEETSVQVRVNLRYERAKRTETVFIESELSSESGQASFSITADVFPILTPRPFVRTINFDPSKPAQLEKESFQFVAYSAAEMVHPLVCLEVPDPLRCVIGDPSEKKIGDLYRYIFPVELTLANDSSSQIQHSNDQLVFEWNDNRFPITVNYVRQGSVYSKPSMVFLKNTPGDDGDSLDLSVKGSSKFEISKVIYNSDLVSVSRSTPDESLTEHRFTVATSIGENSGAAKKDEMVFVLDGLDQPELAIPVLVFAGN